MSITITFEEDGIKTILACIDYFRGMGISQKGRDLSRKIRTAVAENDPMIHFSTVKNSIAITLCRKLCYDEDGTRLLNWSVDLNKINCAGCRKLKGLIP